MQPVPKDMAKALEFEYGVCEEENEIPDSELAIAYNERRHREQIEGSKKVTQSWRMKERVRNIVSKIPFVFGTLIKSNSCILLLKKIQFICIPKSKIFIFLIL